MPKKNGPFFAALVTPAHAVQYNVACNKLNFVSDNYEEQLTETLTHMGIPAESVTANGEVGFACKTAEYMTYTGNISGMRIVKSCTSCNDGYVLTADSKYGPVMELERSLAGNHCALFEGLHYCKAPAKCSASNCDINSGWKDTHAGYQAYIKYSCDSNDKCVSAITKYRCATNYYGTTTNGTSGCTACPSGKFCPAGSTSASACQVNCGYAQYKDGDTCKDCPAPDLIAGDWSLGTMDAFGEGISSCYYSLSDAVGTDRKGTFELADNPETGGPECNY